MAQTVTKAEIITQAHGWGAELIGFAPAGRWPEDSDSARVSHPRTIWPPAQTVIVLGAPLWLPIVEAAPTVLGREQMIVTNDILEKAAYRLGVFLSDKGYQAVSLAPGGGQPPQPAQNPPAAFSHAWAGHYAGLGAIGRSQRLLTREYGPRVNLVSVFTDLELAGDPPVAAELCTQCLYCQNICPAQALTGDSQAKTAQFDQVDCRHYEEWLEQAFCGPCGSCIKVCPVGEDRQLFQSTDFAKYFAEQKVLARDPHAAEYRDWVHLRSYGSYPLTRFSRKG